MIIECHAGGVNISLIMYDYGQTLTIAGIAVGGLVAGIIIEKWVLSILKKAALKTATKVDDILIDSLKGFITVAFFLIGLYISKMYMQSRGVVQNDQLNTVIDRIIYASMVLCGTWFVSRLVSKAIVHLASDGRIVPATGIIRNITRIIIYAIGAMIILQEFGVSITPVLTALGVGGLAVALALQPTLENLFAGLHVTLSRQFTVGDYIEVDGVYRGFVTDINWRATILVTPENNILTIPNAEIAKSKVVNYALPSTTVRADVPLGVGYSSDLKHVEKVTLEIANQIQEKFGMVSDPRPEVLFTGFGDFSINLVARFYTRDVARRWVAISEFVKAIHERYNKEGIEIPFPIRTVLMKTVSNAK